MTARFDVVAKGDLVVNVKDYGAKGDNITDDSAAITAANAAVQAAGGRGTIYFPPGRYRTSIPIQVYSNTNYIGSGIGSTQIILLNGSNCDVIRTLNFDTLTGTSTQGGSNHWSIQGMTLDQNGTNQTSGRVASFFGFCYRVDWVHFKNGKDGGVKSEWGDAGTDMESFWSNWKISNNTGPGLDWQGPHDSSISSGYIYENAGYKGFVLSGRAGGEMIEGVHVWGLHTIGFQFDRPAQAKNCISEGATGAQVVINASRAEYTGQVYSNAATESANAVGVQIGTIAGSVISNYYVDVINWNWYSATNVPLLFVTDGNGTTGTTRDGGGTVKGTISKGTATVAKSNNTSGKTRLDITTPDNPTFGMGFYPQVRIASPISVAIGITNGSLDMYRFGNNGSVGLEQYGNGSVLEGFTDTYTTPNKTWRIDSATGAFWGSNIRQTGVQTKSATYTALVTDAYVLATAGVSGWTLTLPPATAVGQSLKVKKVDIAAGTITVVGQSSATIDGSPTFVMLTGTGKPAYEFVSDGTNWSAF